MLLHRYLIVAAKIDLLYPYPISCDAGWSAKCSMVNQRVVRTDIPKLTSCIPCISRDVGLLSVAWCTNQGVTTTDGRPCPKSSKHGTQRALQIFFIWWVLWKGILGVFGAHAGEYLFWTPQVGELTQVGGGELMDFCLKMRLPSN